MYRKNNSGIKAAEKVGVHSYTLLVLKEHYDCLRNENVAFKSNSDWETKSG